MRPPCLWPVLILFTFLVCHNSTRAQISDYPADSTLTYADSLAIFSLIDSLLQIGDIPASQLAVRTGYNSNVLSAGRTLGVENFGLSPGLSYYHRSGFYADLMAYWSHDFAPRLYLFTGSIGYMHIFSDKLSAIANYDHYFYLTNSEDEYIPYRNAFSVSPYFELKPLSVRLDYSLYIGEKTAHRITPGIALRLVKKDFLNIDRISFYPAVYLLLGNETITEIVISSTDPNDSSTGRYELLEKKVFGIMNYAFSIPLSLSWGNWYFNFSYTYNIPKALPGEPFTLEKSGYISSSLSYFIDLGKDL